MLSKGVWVSTTITSTVLMIALCYVGWWHQQQWRLRCRNLVNKLSRTDNYLGVRAEKVALGVERGLKTEFNTFGPMSQHNHATKRDISFVPTSRQITGEDALMMKQAKAFALRVSGLGTSILKLLAIFSSHFHR
jgi:hypothetical protein